jgi:putative ABC transport system ATP-binding protein
VNPSLEITGISYVVSRALLEGIDLEFRAGELTAISGPSGSGKTTLLSIAGGLLEPTTGTTSYKGQPMWRGTGDPRPEVAFVLQVYGLIPILSARENVSVALRARGVPPREADERAEEALARFHIADLADRQVEELSGGQMQRVACARGLVVGAEVLLADEPTSELDETNRGLVLGELRAEALRGSVVVVATHDPAVVDACDRHYMLDDGRLTDHVAEVDLSTWGRPQPGHADQFQTPLPAGISPGGASRPVRAELVETPYAERGGPAPREPEPRPPDEDPDDDSIFRRPGSEPG